MCPILQQGRPLFENVVVVVVCKSKPPRGMIVSSRVDREFSFWLGCLLMWRRRTQRQGFTTNDKDEPPTTWFDNYTKKNKHVYRVTTSTSTPSCNFCSDDDDVIIFDFIVFKVSDRETSTPLAFVCCTCGWCGVRRESWEPLRKLLSWLWERKKKERRFPNL